MKKIVVLLFIVIALSSLNSCLNDVTSSGGGGREGEVVVVLDEKFQETMAGKYVDSVLRAPFPGLPQYESQFKLFVIPWNAFSNTFKSFRNIVKITISGSVEKSDVTVKRKGMQTVFHFKAPNESSFAKLFMENSQQMVDLLNYSEKNFAKYRIKTGSDASLKKYFSENHQMNVTLPQGYHLRLDTAGFVWLSFETKDISSGVFIYYFPYEDSATFTQDFLLAKRDELLKQHVEGPRKTKKSYMTTEYNYIPPHFAELMVEKEYYTEIRGLWTVVNDYMGGPFIQVTQLDKERNRVVCFDGYVFNPSGDKRKLVRHLEAIAYMIDFPETLNNNEQ